MASVSTCCGPLATPLPIQAVEMQQLGTRHVYFWCKRTIDIVLSASLLVVFFPLMLLIAFLTKLDSTGPVLFVQERIGVKRQTKGRRVMWVLHTFPFYKFRSMVINADQSLHLAYIRDFRSGCTNKNGTAFKLADDSRVTRVGR